MTQTNLVHGFCLLTLLLSVAGCSSQGQIDLGETAGGGNSAGAASASSSHSNSTTGPFSESTMTVQLGVTKYDYSCPAAAASLGPTWQGPSVVALAGQDACPWPRTKPGLALTVLFVGFLPSEGFPPGTYDLTEPANQNIRVVFDASSQAEVLVGQTAPYALYSTVTSEPYDKAPPTAPAAGVSGTVTVVKYGPDGEAFADYDVSVSNVVLPQHSNTGGDFPSTVTIETAHMEKRSQ